MGDNSTITIGEALVRYLDDREVPVVFGIPGVHTVELYRGLARSNIRHVTARHEQGAGFMADGFARVSGKPGVAFVITGPGVTNILTPMGQARSESVPMLVIASVNERADLGKQLGHLHELPDQFGIARLMARRAEHIAEADELMPSLNGIFEDFQTTRLGPMYVQIPLDVMGSHFGQTIGKPGTPDLPDPNSDELAKAGTLLSNAKRPLILAGGGARWSEEKVQEIAERLGAPVVQTINARGMMHGHPLIIPASPSLDTVRKVMREADAILAIGTELGTTDYDFNRDGEMPELVNVVRIDICRDQLDRHPVEVGLCGDAGAILGHLIDAMDAREMSPGWGSDKAAATRKAALAELSDDYRHQIAMLNTIRDTLPGSLLIGDLTQPIYAGNFYYDHDIAGGWFNASAGYGALGYAIPASIGAALAAPERPVICLTGDGGAQFTLPELMTAVDEKLPIIFVVWNNEGYREIETSMAAADVTVVGCDPTPPDFGLIAKACGITFQRCANTCEALKQALLARPKIDGPVMIEIDARG